jgi:hypothetical protein
MQGKTLAFPWIPLVESGLFNGLQRIQIKNLLVQIFYKPTPPYSAFSFAARTPGRPGLPGEQENDSTHSDF